MLVVDLEMFGGRARDLVGWESRKLVARGRVRYQPSSTTLNAKLIHKYEVLLGLI